LYLTGAENKKLPWFFKTTNPLEKFSCDTTKSESPSLSRSADLTCEGLCPFGYMPVVKPYHELLKKREFDCEKAALGRIFMMMNKHIR